MPRLTWVEYPTAAYHIAAHVVMQLQLGRRVFFASLGRHEEHNRCTDGALEAPDALGRRDALARAALERDALYRIAGRAFETHCLAVWSPSHLSSLADRDTKSVRDVLALLNLTCEAQDLSIQYVEARAGQLLAREEVVYRVTRFAHALIENDYLTERTIARLVETIDSVLPKRQRLQPAPRLARTRRLTDPASPVLRPSSLDGPGAEFLFRSRVRSATAPLGSARPDGRKTLDDPREAVTIGTPLATLGLSNLALNTLRRRGGIQTVEMLTTYDDEALLRIRTLGAKTLAEIRDALVCAGHVPPW